MPTCIRKATESPDDPSPLSSELRAGSEHVGLRRVAIVDCFGNDRYTAWTAVRDRQPRQWEGLLGPTHNRQENREATSEKD